MNRIKTLGTAHLRHIDSSWLRRYKPGPVRLPASQGGCGSAADRPLQRPTKCRQARW